MPSDSGRLSSTSTDNVRIMTRRVSAVQTLDAGSATEVRMKRLGKSPKLICAQTVSPVQSKDQKKAAEIKRIRVLNDAFRKSAKGGKVVAAASLWALPKQIIAQALSKMRSFDDFNVDNDPFGEHESGCFEVSGLKFFWKIEAFDRQFRYASSSPADPKKTRRVITLMLAGQH